MIACTQCHDTVHPTAILTPVGESRAWCEDCARSVELPDWAEQLRRAALALIDAPVCSAVTRRARRILLAALTQEATDHWIELQASWVDGAHDVSQRPWGSGYVVARQALDTAARLHAVEVGRAA